MNSTVKTLIPNKEWLITEDHKKLGTISKDKKGYNFLRKGKSIPFKNLAEIKAQLGIVLFNEIIKKNKPTTDDKSYAIYDFPCSSKPYNPVYDVKKKLPLFAKNSKSKSQYCAGHYAIKFRKGWVKGYCPKLITLERYPYYGPFKTDDEVKMQLHKINKYETT